MTVLSEKLRRMAELNFCEGCYRKYTMLLQPQIEEWLSEPIFDWRQTEENVNKLLMKAKGYYKQTANSTVLFPNRDAFSKEMRKKRWGFKRKIGYLHSQGIIKSSLYRLLETTSRIRHRIHKEYTEFSKQDYNLFRTAKNLTHTILLPILFDLKEDRWNRLLADVEKHARQILSELNL